MFDIFLTSLVLENNSIQISEKAGEPETQNVQVDSKLQICQTYVKHMSKICQKYVVDIFWTHL